jgi:hypothetical protein
MATPLPVQEKGTRCCIDRERERWKSGLIADAFGDVLVKRDRVTERTAGRVRGRGKEADVGGVPAVDVWVGNAREDGEILPKILEDLEVVRGRIVGAGAVRKELGGQQAQVVADRQHAARRGGGLCASGGWNHRVQKRQPQADSDAA